MNTTAAAVGGLGVGTGIGVGLGMGCRPLFTASQWQELEHQALIFKYMMAGIPVPPDLLLPIRRSFETMATRFYHHPTMGYCSFYGKKLDPEPGRCRRTDGKKWRCSKDAYPDSKYCERHMHRGRNRSRKPVETPQQQSQQKSPSPSSSTVTSLTPTSGGGAGGGIGGIGGGGGASFPSGIPLHSVSGTTQMQQQGACSVANTTHHQLQMDSGSDVGMGNKDYRYLHGAKADGQNTFYSGTYENTRGLGIESTLENPWYMMQSRVTALTTSEDRNGSIMPSNYSQLNSLDDLGRDSINPLAKRQQHCFFGSDFSSSDTIKHESQQSLRPFFDEWPKTKDSWSELDDDKPDQTSFSTTQLSISIPMASSEFSISSSRSPNAI